MLPALFTGAALRGTPFQTGQQTSCALLDAGVRILRMALGFFAGRPVRPPAFLAFSPSLLL
jgi:hypothetical protein